MRRMKLEKPLKPAAPHAMTELIRDTMASLNGIYYLVSIGPDLLNSGR